MQISREGSEDKRHKFLVKRSSSVMHNKRAPVGKRRDGVELDRD